MLSISTHDILSLLCHVVVPINNIRGLNYLLSMNLWTDFTDCGQPIGFSVLNEFLFSVFLVCVWSSEAWLSKLGYS